MTLDRVRYSWVDYARFASIFLICFYHSPPDMKGVAGVMLSFLRLPSFFFVAGLLFSFERHPSFMKFLFYRGKLLLTPYFGFFVIFYVYWLIIGKSMSTPVEQSMPFYSPLTEFIYGRPYLVCMPLWFLACLFILQSSFYIFQKINNRFITVVLLVIVSFLPSLIDMSNSPWMLENVCQYIPFYGVASMYRKEFFSFMENKRRFAISAILLLLNIACSFVYYSLVNEQVNEEVKTVFRLAGSFAVIVPFFVIVKLISEKKMPKIVRYIGANTVIVLACHTYGISLLMIVSRNIGIVNLFLTEFPYISKTLICITVMIAMVMPIYVINRYIPFIIGKKNIDRPV